MASNFDAVVLNAKEAGFDVSMADWLGYQTNQTLALSDADLEAIAGGTDESCGAVYKCVSRATECEQAYDERCRDW